MRVQLHQIRRTQGELPTVTFESSYGWATAQWIGGPPVEGASRFVQLVIPAVLTWGYEVSRTKLNRMIFEEANRVCIVGRICSYTTDGRTVLELDGNLFAVEIANAPRHLSGRLILRTPQLHLLDLFHARR